MVFSFKRSAILPISVAIPIAVTMAFPRPATTVHPLNTILSWSPNDSSSFATNAASFSTASLSPVSTDSSTRNWDDSIKRASAEIASPDSKTRISPTTSCSDSTVVTLPSRMTVAVCLFISCKDSSAFSAFPSWTIANTELITTIAMTSSPSNKSPCSVANAV